MPMRRFAMMVFGLVLTACGGGGDDRPTESTGPTMTFEAASVLAGQVTHAILRDGDGRTLDPGQFSWSSSHSEIAVVSEHGTVVTFDPGLVTIQASSPDDPELVITADLTIAPSPPPRTLPALELSPMVLSTSGDDSVSIIVDGTPTTTAATLTLGLPPYEVFPLRRLEGSSRFQFVLSQQEVRDFTTLAASGSPSVTCFFGGCILGTVELAATDPDVDGRLLFADMPIVDADQPLPAVRVLDADVQATAYVVNVRDDGDRDFQAVTRKFYRHFRDVYQYVVVGEVATVDIAPSFNWLRNRTSGLGAGARDFTAAFGADPAGELLGIVDFAQNTFDLGHVVTSHELAHAFMCRLRGTPLLAADSHWPHGSTAAFGIMGSAYLAINVDRVLTPLGDGRFRVDARTPWAGFNELELYLLGLADPSEVPDQFVFANPAQSIEIGSVLEGPATRVTIDDVVAAVGPRVPAWDGTPVTFRAATIVVSRGRLLTPLEMAYYDRQARNGEATERGDEPVLMPFYVATRGRGILVTRLDAPPAPTP